MSYISNTCTMIRIVCELGEAINNLTTTNNGASIIGSGNKIFIVGLNIFELIAKSKGCSLKTLEGIKEGELVLRCVDLPLKLYQAICDKKPILNVMVDGVLSPITSLIRTGAEVSIYQNKIFLDMIDRGENVVVPIFKPESDPPQLEIVGYKHLSREECEDMLRKAQAIKAPMEVVEVVLKTAATACNVYDNLAKQGNFASLNSIPESLKDDVIFKRYICAYSKKPIRFAVSDGKYTYDKFQVSKYLKTYKRSPMTNEPLEESQLKPKPTLQKIIDDRLKFHESFLNQLHMRLI